MTFGTFPIASGFSRFVRGLSRDFPNLSSSQELPQQTKPKKGRFASRFANLCVFVNSECFSLEKWKLTKKKPDHSRTAPIFVNLPCFFPGKTRIGLSFGLPGRPLIFLFLGLLILLKAPTRNSPERVRDIRSFPEKKLVGPPRLTFSQTQVPFRMRLVP